MSSAWRVAGNHLDRVPAGHLFRAPFEFVDHFDPEPTSGSGDKHRI